MDSNLVTATYKECVHGLGSNHCDDTTTKEITLTLRKMYGPMIRERWYRDHRVMPIRTRDNIGSMYVMTNGEGLRRLLYVRTRPC